MWRSMPNSAIVSRRYAMIDGPVGDRLLRVPRLELEAERVHVAVGADAGIAEQVPGAADVGAPFEDQVGAVRRLDLQVIGGADAGDAGADHEDIDMLNAHASTVVPAAEPHELLTGRDVALT